MTLTLTDTPLPRLLERMDAERLRVYRENLDFYNGLQWPSRPRGRERHLTFNYARTVVDKVTSYLMADLRSVIVPTGPAPEEGERARRAEGLLAEVAEANNLDQLDFDTEVNNTLGPAERRVFCLRNGGGSDLRRA